MLCLVVVYFCLLVCVYSSLCKPDRAVTVNVFDVMKKSVERFLPLLNRVNFVVTSVIRLL